MALAPKLSQVMRFLSAGGLGVLLYYLTLYILTDIAGVWYMASAVVASIVNYSANFVLQKYWAFENKDAKNIHRQAGKYALMVMSLFAANLLLLYLLVEYAHIQYLIAQVIATIPLTITSYFATRAVFTG